MNLTNDARFQDFIFYFYFCMYENLFFACLQGVLIDVCCLGQESSLLQQGCDITGGQYFKVPQPQGLLQYLLVRY
jgi:transcription initiation factor TFIIH subunit 3